MAAAWSAGFPAFLSVEIQRLMNVALSSPDFGSIGIS
jgi:hypothetical protein